MYKLVFLIGCLAVMAGQGHSQDFLNLLRGETCRNYNAVPNFDVKKFLGTWYDLASSDKFFDDKKCSKNIMTTLPNGNILLNNTLAAAYDNSPILILFPYRIDSQNNFYFNWTARDSSLVGGEAERPIEVKLSPVYIDYDNIAVFYQCWHEQNNFIQRKNEELYIWTRKRNFDSLAIFEKAVGGLGYLEFNANRLKFLYNGNACTN